ncbi:DUF2239 family protein [Schlesneria paludicola]|uniref:DUF2239 family protein n=1 Tax=Schlesneria paludicola TaxID=360056 RepID=UPI00029B184C|nr:DUF2239 family protein [Schlesneria paludicola]
MQDQQLQGYTCFDGHRRLATGTLQSVALVVKRAMKAGAAGPVLIFDNSTGRSIDIDTRGRDDEVLARLPVVAVDDGSPSDAVADEEAKSDSRGRGRPKLGVVAREITLLPRHWDWLATQSGGASVAIRRLVEDARRTHADKDRMRKRHEAAYHFMSAIAGDLPGFEEATRALFANSQSTFESQIADWPVDLREHARHLAFPQE